MSNAAAFCSVWERRFANSAPVRLRRVPDARGGKRCAVGVDGIRPENRSGSMNWDEVEGNWKQLKGKVRSQWGKLTDDDLEAVKGKRDELLGLLQKRYGHAKDAAEREIDRWTKELK
jgi:uncharacterized protein YjbJ (UPF0337 family)